MTVIQDAMAAAAFAEAGEFDTTREMLKAGAERKKRVLLGIDGCEIKPKLIKYAYDLSRRVGGQLEVLQFLTPGTKGILPECTADADMAELKKKGIAHRVITGLGTIEEDILAYTREKHDVLMVLLKNLGNNNETNTFTQVMDELNCPVVVFSEIT